MHGTNNIDLQATIEHSIDMDLIIGAWLSNLKDITSNYSLLGPGSVYGIISVTTSPAKIPSKQAQLRKKAC